MQAGRKAGHQQELYYKHLCHWVCLRIGLTASFSLWQNARELSEPQVDKALCTHAFHIVTSDFEFLVLVSVWGKMPSLLHTDWITLTWCDFGDVFVRKWVNEIIHGSVFYSALFFLMGYGQDQPWTEGLFYSKASVFSSAWKLPQLR